MNGFKWMAVVTTICVLVSGCDGGTGTPDDEQGGDEAVVVDGAVPAEVEEKLAALSDIQSMSADEVLAAYALEQGDDLGYDPLDAQNLSIIQDSAMAMNADELQVFEEYGFVISDRWLFPTFGYGYVNLYAEDLPVFVSADSLLFALHRSYSTILQTVEMEVLIRELTDLLEGMRSELEAGQLGWASQQIVEDVDFYLAVALSLLDGELVDTVAGADSAMVLEWVSAAHEASGTQQIKLFGARREVDFSQFRPRGHYLGMPMLERYFRAMMWLGRIDLRIVEPTPRGELMVHPQQAMIAAGLVELMTEAERQRWERIDATLEAFVGESDNMRVGDLERLMSDLELGSPAEFATIDPQEIADILSQGDYGDQRISGHIMKNGVADATLPLAHTFLLLGQRYVVDSHVFSNVVYDRVSTSPRRMLPDPLDAAFAALKNDQALQLLEEQLERYDYAGALAAMRYLIDSHDESYWDKNMYTSWLGALRALSPKADEVAAPDDHGLPSVAATEAWGRRILNTQLASWAELRHDTLLYAKQSYSSGAVCEYPDAYVDPYPEFYDRMAAFAANSRALLNSLEFNNEWSANRVDKYFVNMEEVHTTLGEMAHRQRNREPLDEEHLEFINRQVTLIEGCAGPDGIYGWYGDLFYLAQDAIDFDPTIADVHTAPTDAGGNPTGDVLHVATGYPRLMITTFDTCDGPRAFAGVVSSYFEKLTDDYDRWDNQRWADEMVDEHPDDLWWMDNLVVR